MALEHRRFALLKEPAGTSRSAGHERTPVGVEHKDLVHSRFASSPQGGAVRGAVHLVARCRTVLLATVHERCEVVAALAGPTGAGLPTTPSAWAGAVTPGRVALPSLPTLSVAGPRLVRWWAGCPSPSPSP